MLYPRHGVQRFGYSLWSLQMQHVQHELFNQHLHTFVQQGWWNLCVNETCSGTHGVPNATKTWSWSQRICPQASCSEIFIDFYWFFSHIMASIMASSWETSWSVRVLFCSIVFGVTFCCIYFFLRLHPGLGLAVHRFQLRCTRARKPTLTLTQLSSTTARQTTQASQSSWRMLASRMCIAAELQATLCEDSWLLVRKTSGDIP